eukprot:7569417-Pyramimonas_sp.AAC.1
MLWELAGLPNASWSHVNVFNGRVTGRPRCRICRGGTLVPTGFYTTGDLDLSFLTGMDCLRSCVRP